MYRVMTADEAMSLIKDGDVIALNSFLGVDNPVELHEALYERFKKTGSPKHLTCVSRIYKRGRSGQDHLWTFRCDV